MHSLSASNLERPALLCPQLPPLDFPIPIEAAIPCHPEAFYIRAFYLTRKS
jgi:hypothetical protein